MKSTAEFTDGTSYIVGSYCMTSSDLKKNHEVKKSIYGIDYVCNNDNGRCYKII